MDKRIINRTGEKNKSKEGVLWEIIEYRNSRDITVKSEYGEIVTRTYQNFKLGEIKSIYHKSVYGVGYLGCSDCISKSKSYLCWQSMLRRCYDSTFKNDNPTYINTIVDSKWHNYSTFRDWFDENYIEGWQLDKDILGNGEIYNEDICVFVPSIINNFTTNNQKGNTTGYPGVSYISTIGKFRCMINKFGKGIRLGESKNPKKLYLIYCQERERYAKELVDIYKEKLDLRIIDFLEKYREG